MKKTITLILTVSMLFLIASPPSLAVNSAENQTNIHSCNPIDNIINSLIVKSILLIRDSKSLFSSKDNADEYLENMLSEDYNIADDISNLKGAQLRQNDKTQYLVFGNENSDTYIFYLHGGAFVRHMTSLHLSFMKKLSKKSGACIVAPAYLTAPAHQWSESIEQLTAIYQNILNEHPNSKVVFMGDSSGAAIAVEMQNYLISRKIPQPCKLILLSPLLELDVTKNEDMKAFAAKDPMFGGVDGLQQFIKAWAGDTSLDSPEINPMSTDFSALPETHIYIGSSDMLSFDAKLFFEKATENNADVTLNIYEKMYHCFMIYPLISSMNVLNETAKIVKSVSIDK
ncbi:MAG: alpha/beta hydrolase [Ruminococcus sp.]|nr:alpha/beta hydrolase [Ruminococcus sp.]